MTKKNATPTMANLDNATIRAIIEDIDGHTIIMRPEMLLERGMPADVLESLVYVETAGRGKEAIFTADGVLPPGTKVRSVNGLSLIRRVAGDIGADTSGGDGMTGRGFASRAYLRAIEVRLKEREDEHTTGA